MTSLDLTADDLRALLRVPFTDEQVAAITAPHAPSVVIAGAGSGKTALMSARVVWLVAQGQVTPDQVLGLTFTNKAAAELSHRVRQALRSLADWAGVTELLDDGEPTISTYHSYAAALIREYGVWGGLEPTASLLSEAQRVQIAERVVRRAPGPFTALQVRPVTMTERVLTLDAELNEHLVDPADLVDCDQALIATIDEVERERGKLTADPTRARDTARARQELLAVVRDFRAEKARRERVDFGDQMASAALLAERVPEVAAGERSRFATVLLDEYQDTSMAQQRLLVALYGDRHPVLAVGDPFQSIYGWRGASVRNIVSFRHDFATSEPTPLHTLSQNNRSGGRILAAANRVAEALRGAFPDVVELSPRPERADDGEVLVGLFDTVDAEVAVVCDAVAAEIGEGVPPASIAILCRETRAFSALVGGLTRRGVPVEVVGLAGLLELPEVLDVLSVLEVLYDPTANPAVVRMLTGPRWRIGPEDLAVLGLRAQALSGFRRSGATRSLATELAAAVADTDPSETLSLSEAIDDPGDAALSPAARERLARLAAELDALRPVLHMPIEQAIATVVATTGLDVELAAHGVSREHLDALLDEARQFTAGGGGPGVGPFLAYVDLARRHGAALTAPAPTGTGGVQLLTVHKAKGLEWSSVYLPHVVDGVFPNRTSRSTPLSSPGQLPYELRGDADDFPVVTDWSGNLGVKAFKDAVAVRELAEDRRLAYVALTRAANRLVVTGHRWGNGSKPRPVSTYLQVLKELCDVGGAELLHWAEEPADGATNPRLAGDTSVAWPPRSDPDTQRRRRRAADLVEQALSAPVLLESMVDQLDADEQRRVQRWDDDVEALLAAAAAQTSHQRPTPGALSATSWVEVLRAPDETLSRLHRPLPAAPASAARRGTAFHAWVEARFGQVPLIDVDDLLPDDGAELDADLVILQESFLAGPYADRRPAAVEAPFHMMVGDRAVTGRIDAVYEIDPHDPAAADLPAGTRYEVVDWKTGRSSADPLQLALYRLAWAELHGLSVHEVSAAFYYVATGRVERPGDLPDRNGLTEAWTALHLG